MHIVNGEILEICVISEEDGQSRGGDTRRDLNLGQTNDAMDESVSLRLETYSKRREAALQKLTSDLRIAQMTHQFLTDRSLLQQVLLARFDSQDPEQILAHAGFERVEGSFDFLLTKTLAKDDVRNLESHIVALKAQKEQLERDSPGTIWTSDLEKLKRG
jgi:hypothetical protein